MEINESSSSLSESNNTPLVESWCHTRTEVIQFHYKWTLSDFCLLQHKTGEFLDSSTVKAGANDEIKCSLRLYPKGNTEETKNFLSLFVSFLKSNGKEFYVKYKFSILNAKGEKINEFGDGKYNINNPNIFTGYSEFIDRKSVLNESKGFLTDNSDLVILCEVCYLSDSVNTSGRKSIREFDFPECKIADDFSNLLDNPKFSDVTLVVDEHKIQAHKAVLGARSKVFAAMFSHEMKENKLNSVTITDIDHKVLKNMLHFIYTNEFLDLQDPDQLLIAADKYALDGLKVIAEEALYDVLSIATAIKTLIIADRYSANQLKERTIEFINDHAKAIVKTNGWKDLLINHPNLIAEAFEALFS